VEVEVKLSERVAVELPFNAALPHKGLVKYPAPKKYASVTLFEFEIWVMFTPAG
jgi:hypothetical protein